MWRCWLSLLALGLLSVGGDSSGDGLGVVTVSPGGDHSNGDIIAEDSSAWNSTAEDISAGNNGAGGISAGNSSAGVTSAGNITAQNISSGNSSVGDISAGNSSVGDISAGDISEGAAGVEPQSTRCQSLMGDETFHHCEAEAPLQIVSKRNEYVNIECEAANITCGRVPRLPLSGGGVLDSASVTGCAPELIACALRAFGASGARTLWLTRPAGGLDAQHVAGLQGVGTLVLFDAESVRDLPLAAARALPELRSLRVSGANLRLQEDMFASGPLQPPLNLTYLLLSGDHIPELPDGAFRGLTSLQKLIITKNNIEDVGPLAFDGLESVERLCLDANGLRGLPAGVLAPLLALHEALLDRNRFTAMPRGLFRGLHRLANITISGNSVELSLASGAFEDLPALASLKLLNSRITALAPDFIVNCSRLVTLDLGRNRLAQLPRDVFRGLVNLRELDLSRNRLAAVPADVFQALRRMQVLRLDGNQIEVLPDELFAGLTSLTTFSANDNLLHTVAPRALAGAALTTLSLSGNRLTLRAGQDGLAWQYGEFLQSPLNSQRELVELHLARNRLAEVFDDWRNVMLKLQTLDLAGNRFQKLTDTETQFLSSGLKVDLRNNNISAVELDAYKPGLLPAPAVPLGGSSTPNEFLLDGNPLSCGCELTPLMVLWTGGDTLASPRPVFHLGDAVCAEPPGLKGRLVRDVTPIELQCSLDPRDCPVPCSCVLKSYEEVVLIDCPAPPVWPDGFRDTHLDVHLKLRNSTLKRVPPFVTSLDLSDTGIVAADFAFDGTLRRLNLTGNRLAAVPERLLRANVSLALAKNPLRCECSDRAAIGLLKRAQAERGAVVDFGEVTCAGGERLAELPADSLCDARDSAVAAATAVGIVLLVAVALGALAAMYRRELLVLVLRSGCGGRLLAEKRARLAADAALEWDVFVSFSHRDAALVCGELLPRLERRRRVCARHRDFAVGELIPAQSVRAVERSRRTLALLTPAWARSRWAALEFRAAHALALRGGRACPLLVLLDAAALQEPLPADVRAYLATGTYLRYDDPRFWERLERALPPRLAPPPPAAGKAGALDVQLNADGILVNAAAAKDAV